MSMYELKWSDGKLNSKGGIIIQPGYVYAPVSEIEDPLFNEFISKVESCIDRDFDIRFAKAVAKWFDPIRAYMNENGFSDTDSPNLVFDPNKIRDLVTYVEFTDLIDFSTAKNKVFPELINNFSDERTWEIMERIGVLEKTDSSEIDVIIDEVLSKYPDKVLEHKSGKKNLVGLFMGEIMRSGKIKANPKELSDLIKKKLEL